MSTSQPSELKLRLLPNSEDARLFVELSSYTADLTEARTALELALDGVGDDGRLGRARQFLIGHAAVAYCRTFFTSAVRAPMTDHVSIPERHSELHEQIADYRNRRVAHSHSHLSSTFAFIGLDADGSIRPGVIGLTASQELPVSFLQPWIDLIDLISSQIDDLQTTVETRILDKVAAEDIDVVRAWPAQPALVEQSDSEFTARPSRGRYPTDWTTFWSPTN